jgi:hypothetical protein
MMLALLTSFALAGQPTAMDTDGDGVDDLFDVCPGSDDTVDLNLDGTPDCAQSMIPRSPIDSYSDTTFWTPYNGTFSGFSGVDAKGYLGSGSLRNESTAPGGGVVGHRICVRIAPPYGDDLSVWLQGGHIGSGTLNAVTRLQEFSSSNCTLGAGAIHQDAYQVPAGSFEESRLATRLRSSTRSVQLTVESNTFQQQFLVDNILMLRSPRFEKPRPRPGTE